MDDPLCSIRLVAVALSLSRLHVLVLLLWELTSAPLQLSGADCCPISRFVIGHGSLTYRSPQNHAPVPCLNWTSRDCWPMSATC